MKKIVFILLLTLVGLTTPSCTDEDATKTALRKAGFTDVAVTGWKIFSCGEDDTYSTGFEAKNPNGDVVTGVVCCGLIVKACTIRF